MYPGPTSQDPIEPTIADVIARIAARTDLTKARRESLCSALRRACTILGEEPASMSADPGALRSRLRALGPVVVGLSPGSWRNIRSLTGRALKEGGVVCMPGRASQPLSVTWLALMKKLTSTTVPWALSRFMRYCSESRISPDEVNDAVMERFKAVMFEQGVCARPKAAHKAACQLWNRAADMIEGWPPTRLTIPDYRRRVALPDTAFPASFITEVAALLRDLAGVDRLAGGDRLARLGRRPRRKITIDFRRRQIMQLASALVHRHPAAKEAMTLRYLVDHADEALRYFLDRIAEGGTTGQIHNLAIALKQVGRHLRVDEAQLERLRGYCRGTAPDDTGMTEKNRRRLQPFRDPANLITLLRLPEQVRRSVSQRAVPSAADAVEIELAVAVEILLMKPMRIASLAGLDFDKHVSPPRPGRDGVTSITVPAAMVKNRLAFEAELPATSAELVELYRRRYQPLLAKGTSWLFPGEDGEAKRPDALGAQITRFIKRETGLVVNPHLFRHIAAIIILNRDPGAYVDVKDVLGTKTIEIIIKHYCGEETRAALARYDSAILGLRQQPDDEPPPPCPTRRRRRR